MQGQVNFYIGQVDPEQGKISSSPLQPSSSSPPSRLKGFRSQTVRFFGDEKNKEASKSIKQTSFQSTDKLLFKIMTNGSYFGEVDIIFRRKRVYFLATASDCDLYLLSRTEFENIVMNEYPHIFQEMKALAVKREERDLEMIESSLKRAREENQIRDWMVAMEDETIMKNVRTLFRDSVATEVDDHEIQPLEEMFEEMKEKLPLEELLNNFEVSRSDGEEEEDEEASADSDIKFEDVSTIGLQKMYSQFRGRPA